MTQAIRLVKCRHGRTRITCPACHPRGCGCGTCQALLAAKDTRP